LEHDVATGGDRSQVIDAYRVAPAPVLSGRKREEIPMLRSALLMTAGIAIGFGANPVLAQSNAAYYLVAEINVKDKKR